MGDDPSKRHYFYPSFAPPSAPYSPPGASYAPPPGIYPPPYPGGHPYQPSPYPGPYQPPHHQPMQPTMVTSVYHAPPSQQVSVTAPPSYYSLGYSWVAVTPSTCHHLEGSAVVAGYESDRNPIWVGRANHQGDLIPCKVIPRSNAAYIAYGGEEVAKTDIDVLCADPVRVKWTPSSNGYQVPGAVNGGHTVNGETLYIGRAHYQGSITPGKIHPSHQCLYIPFAGREIPIKSYEALVIY